MGSRIRCFWADDTGRVMRSLRRYVRSSEAKCSGPFGYHNASVEIGEHPADTDADGYIAEISPDAYAGDPHWPTRCPCGYEFTPADQWQVFQESIYRNIETGEEHQMRRLPPGALYDAWWLKRGKLIGPDGICLALVLPPAGGDADVWIVDGPARGGGRWTRTGTVPNVTASPSILTPRYHGWLRDGWLVEC